MMLLLFISLFSFSSAFHNIIQNDNTNILEHNFPTQYVTLDISSRNPDQQLGQIHIHLFGKDQPKSVENFVQICKGDYISRYTEDKLTYENCPIHGIFSDFIIMTGDITNGDGTGGESIYGYEWEIESTPIFNQRYTVGYSSRDQYSQNSQFFISLERNYELDGQHNVFGYIIDQKSRDLVDQIAQYGDSNGQVQRELYISKCFVAKK